MNEIRQLRKQTGLTQIEAAKELGISRRTLQTYEENDIDNESNRRIFDELLKMLEDNMKHHPISIVEIKNKCTEVFKKYPEVRCAYLYGSYARREANGHSDVDLLVVCPAMGLKFYRLAKDLEIALNKKVDLQTHRQIGDNQDFLENLLTEGVKIYEQKRRVDES